MPTKEFQLCFGVWGKARDVVLEMAPDKWNTEERIKLLYENLDSLFKVHINQASLMVYGNFEKYKHCWFQYRIWSYGEYEIKLPDSVLT